MTTRKNKGSNSKQSMRALLDEELNLVAGGGPHMSHQSHMSHSNHVSTGVGPGPSSNHGDCTKDQA